MIEFGLGRLYAFSIAATKHETFLVNEDITDSNFQHRSIIIIASMIEEAASEARSKMYELWPEEEGWQDHSIAVIEVPTYIIKDMNKALIIREKNFNSNQLN